MGTMILDLGKMTLPETLLPKLQAIFGGATAIETRDAIRLWVGHQLRTEFLRQRRVIKSRELALADEALLQAQDAADAADFPEGVPV